MDDLGPCGGSPIGLFWAASTAKNKTDQKCFKLDFKQEIEGVRIFS